MSRQNRRGGRVTPKRTRPPHLRLVGSPPDDDSPADSMIDSGGRELLDHDDPVTAEVWGSGLLGVLDAAREQARLDGMEVPPFEEALLERCRQRRDKRAAVVVAALAAVLPPPHDRLAATVVSQLRGSVAGLPGWVGTIGLVRPTRCWVASDVFDDQASLIVAFAQQGAAAEHALVVLVDHNLSGQAKDAWIGPDVEGIVDAWQATGDPHMRLSETPVDEALARLRDAMAVSDLWNGDSDLRTEEFAQHQALIWARLRRAGLAGDRPTGVEVDPSERRAIVDRFMASPHGRDLSGRLAGADVELLAHHVIDLRADYEGRPLRWSPTVVALVLADLAPRKLLLDPDDAAALPAVVRAFVRFSAERTGLDATFVDEILAAVDKVEPTYRELIGDPAAAGPAKALMAALQARGVDPDDVDAINQALDQAGPIELRTASPPRRRRRADAPADVTEAAERAPVLARFGILAAFYGDGRKLTQTGQPTLADARELVTLLGTGDRMDASVGGRVFKTKSAAELPELGFTLRWGVAAGALRKEHGWLRATASWTKLERRPLERWTKAADALLSLGPLACYHATNRYRHDEVLDELAPSIVQLLGRRPLAYDEVLDWVCDRADEEYEWLTPVMQDPDSRRTVLRWDLDLFARILEWAGIADRLDAPVETDPYGSDRLVGGTLRLTPVGRWWLGVPAT
jgi:hypothetical protein